MTAEERMSRALGFGLGCAGAIVVVLGAIAVAAARYFL